MNAFKFFYAAPRGTHSVHRLEQCRTTASFEHRLDLRVTNPRGRAECWWGKHMLKLCRSMDGIVYISFLHITFTHLSSRPLTSAQFSPLRVYFTALFSMSCTVISHSKVYHSNLPAEYAWTRTRFHPIAALTWQAVLLLPEWSNRLRGNVDVAFEAVDRSIQPNASI